MAPSNFQEAREATVASSALYCAQVDGRPYLPNLSVDTAAVSSLSSSIDDEDALNLSVAKAAVAVVLAAAQKSDNVEISFLPTTDEELRRKLTVDVVSGGITNSLYRVSGLRELDVLSKEGKIDESFLVRVFGAEGMIDRDVESSTLATLVDQGIADRYLGRFANGRLEGWLEGYRPLAKEEFSDPQTSDAIAAQMANLHSSYVVPEYLQSHHDPSKPAMWTQLHAWMKQARGYDAFKTEHDTERAKELELAKIEAELTHLEQEVVPPDAGVAFCHNDLLAANIMICPTTGRIQLIDFEYGGVNYRSFDIANHFNEFAGGTTEEENGVPDYSLFPTEKMQEAFVRAYVRAARKTKKDENGNDYCVQSAKDEDKEVYSLLREVRAFVLANHLYWGLWAVNQAAMEGCEDFDYLTYASCRFGEYHKGKAKIEAELAC